MKTKPPEIIIEKLDVSPDMDPRQIMLEALMHCPECRAAIERGERPHIVVPPVRRAGWRMQRVRRWREQKRRR